MSATIKLDFETKDFATKANDASTAFLGMQLAAGGTGLALKGMGAAARSSIAEVALGAQTVDRLNASLGKAAANSSKLSSTFGQISNLAYNAALATTAVSGLAAAVSEFNRIPQTLATINASGINAQTIAEFGQLKEAIGGNQESVESFVNTAIARLGEFERAAARSATILKSSTRFDEAGNALRVNNAESLANAISIQQLVTNKLDNAVSSSSALLAQYEVLSAGFVNQQDSEKVLETALKLTQIGRAGGVASDAGENAKLISKSLQAYSLGANDAARTGAILNEVVAQGITTIPELSSVFGAAGSSAAKAGVSMPALGAGIAQLTSLGQDTAEAATGLKGLADTIINKTPEAAAELAKLSLNGQRIRFDAAEVQAKGLVQALLDVNKAAGNSPEILAKIFPDKVVSRAVTGLISGGGVGFKARYDAINAATSQSLDEVAELASDTRVDRMQKLANKFGEIVITIAQSVAPVVEPGLDALKRIADSFSAIPEPVKKALGTWIAAQITAKSTAAGIGILVKTLGDLAGIYAVGRVLSLAMTGQLGAELTVIKELIVQRKGLASVLLQTIGINQRHRLGVDAATAALTNQGIVAKAAYAAQVKSAELASAASNKFKDIWTRNVASAKATAAELASTPVAGAAVNAGTGIVNRARNIATNVANSQTGQNIRTAAGDFLNQNPAIGTAATEIKQVATAAIDKIKTVTGATTAAARARITDPNLIPDPWDDAPAKIGDAIGVEINKATAVGSNLKNKATTALSEDPSASIRARIQQLIDAELKLTQSKLVADYAKTQAKFAKLDDELNFKQRNSDSKRAELLKQQERFNKRSERLEENKKDLSPIAYQKGVEKLNRDGAKIKELEQSIKEDATPLADLQRERARLYRQLVGQESKLAQANINAQERFTPLVNLESRLQKVNDRYEKAQTKAATLETYAADINKIAPNSPQAIAANKAAQNAAITQSALAGRTQKLEAQYQELLTTTGARAALLAERGLAQVRYGSGTATYSTNSKLESLLYADVGKSVKGAIESAGKFIGNTSLSGTFIYLRSTAQAAAAALGKIGEVGLIKSVREGLTNLPSKIRDLSNSAIDTAKAAYQAGGIKGVARTGLDAYIDKGGALGEKLLPFVPTAIAKAVVPLTIPTLLGAAVLREDFKRAQLAGEFRASVEETLKKDRELQSKYEDRSRPFAELQAAVAQIAEGKNVQFSTKSIITTPTLASGAIDTVFAAPGRAIDAAASGIKTIGNLADNTVAPKFTPDNASAYKQLDPVREQLKLLAQSGQLTSDQFKDLDTTLVKMGGSGKISATELEKFNAKLKAVASQEKPIAKGVGDTIGDTVKAIPGFLGNLVTGAVDSAANGLGSILTLKGSDEVAKNREADALISYLGDDTKLGSLTSLTDKILAARVETTANRAIYRQGGALDKVNDEKVKKGVELTSADIEREKLQTSAQIDRNNNLVADYDTKLKSLNEQLEKQKNPENKALLQNAINAYTAQKDALIKNTEGLKAASEAFAKYYTETVPGLIRALAESQDPTKAVKLAGDDFNNIYQKDSSGATTAYIKDIAQLRAESAKYNEAIVSKYAIDNSANAEAEAIANLKSQRDNQITLPTGESGKRETIANQIAITDQIVKIQQEQTTKVIAAKTLEVDRLKVLTSQGALSETTARIQTANKQIEISQETLAAKEREIQEYAQFPRKVVELERQAATMRVQLEQQVADRQLAIRERAFALAQAQFDIQVETLKTTQAELRIGNLAYIEQSSQIELNRAKSQLQKLYEDRSRLTEDSPELNDKIAVAEQKYRQTVANSQTQIFDARQQLAKQQLDLDAARRTQPLNIANKQIETEQKLGELRANTLNSNRDILAGNLDLQQTHLNNESKLANTAVKRAQIELKSTQAKLASIEPIAAAERESLVLQQQLTELSAIAQKNQLNISRIEQQKTIKELELQKLKLNRDKSNSPEIKAQREQLEYQIGAAKIQLTGLDTQANVLDKQLQTNRQITEAKLKQKDYATANAKETERVNALLADINVKTAKITEAVDRQNLGFTAQTQQLQLRSGLLDLHTKQLDTQAKILSTQQGLINARAESRDRELGIMSGLTTIENTKLNIARTQATVKLQSLNQQIKLERDILELNIQQQQATLNQDKLKQQIAETQAEREVVLAKAAYDKLEAKGKLADPIEKRAAELDLKAKLDAQVLTRSNRGIIAQQEVANNYSAYAQRQQLDYKQKNQLQEALVNYSNTGDDVKAQMQNDLFNAIGRGEATKYYEEWAQNVVKNAPPLAVPQFNSPYDSRSNYNRPGVAEPQKLIPSSDVTVKSGLGTLEPTRVPQLNAIDTTQFQRDAAARYAEFIRQPIKVEVERVYSTPTERGKSELVKPINLNLQLTNDIKIAVASGQETKDTIVNSSLDAIDDVLRLAKERYG